MAVDLISFSPVPFLRVFEALPMSLRRGAPKPKLRSLSMPRASITPPKIMAFLGRVGLTREVIVDISSQLNTEKNFRLHFIVTKLL